MGRMIAASTRDLLRGAATIFDISGLGIPTVAVTDATEEQIDAEAIRRDWLMVGMDMHNAVRVVASRAR